ncbi:MAG: hypothetical protein AAF549_03780 [Pseudomonadota bacterium]
MNKIQKIVQFLLAKENRLGAIILFIGIIALGFVSFAAIDRFASHSGQYAELSEEEIANFRDESYFERRIEEENRQRVEQEQERLRYERQQDIKRAQIEGAWDMRNEAYRGLLQLSQGNYKLVLIHNTDRRLQRYSVGTYDLKDDILTFRPRYSAQAQREFAGYSRLTASTFPVLVSKQGSRLVLQRPTRDAGVFVPNYHPFLNIMPDEIAIFQTLK